MAEIQHELKIKADPSAVFEALTTAQPPIQGTATVGKKKAQIYSLKE